jgi:hypothetical protein
MTLHLRLRHLHHYEHSHYRFPYRYHQVIDARRDYRRLHRYIRVGCARRRGGGILCWQVQSPVPLLYLSRSALARLSSRSSFLCGTSCQLLWQFKGPTFWQRAAGFVQRFLRETWFPHSTWRGLGLRARVRLTHFSACSALMSE